YRTLYELYQHAHTPWEWIPALFDRAHEKDISIFGSVFDETAVDLLEKQQVPAYKIAAPEIRDIPLLKKVAATGKPVFLSSGISTLDELARAVRIVRETGGQPIIMKCSTAYPTPPQEVNLKTIPNLIEIFDCPVGLSDHTLGMGASIGAVALGAMVIEKHVKLPDEEDTVDSFFSLKIEEFAHLVREIKTAQSSLGAVNYEITPEVSKNRNGHRSLYVCAPIKAGEIFSAKNIKSVRPGFGLDTAYYDLVLGRKAARDLAAGDRLAWDLIS
ncbi:MAG: pseudaminic acid synthase, partial [Verrucomicrobiae bacterium]|nr:pseudaminic acid synthase [Verrucomicrobiae bacterium]